MVLILKQGATEAEKQKIRAQLRKPAGKHPGKAGVDLKKYAGVVKLKKDPREVQKAIRNEW